MTSKHNRNTATRAWWRVALGLWAAGAVPLAAEALPSWSQIFDRKAEWFGSAEAAAVTEVVLALQNDDGGWTKNVDLRKMTGAEAVAAARKAGAKDGSTIDNRATWSQMLFLADMVRATGRADCRAAFDRGLAYLLSGQKPNGGWPQFFPKMRDYQKHVTFNDHAMTGVLFLLEGVARGEGAFAFTSGEQRAAARAAVDRGLECVLKAQVRDAQGRPTAWCAQHEAETLAPAPARSFEPASLSGLESVGILAFLLCIQNPDTEVRAAAEGAARWLEGVKITGVRIDRPPLAEMPGERDQLPVADAAAPPVWARFYELGSDRPIFIGRDGVIRYDIREIELERRAGYGYYVDAPRTLLERDFPAWQARGPLPWAKAVRYVVP